MTKAEKTRQFIIEKAAPIITRKGMAGTSITDIMEATRLAKGGIYGNFESKEEICAEAFDHLLGGLAKNIATKLDTKTTAKDKLLALLEFYKGLLTKEDYAGCPMLNFGIEADDTNPAVKQQVSKAITATQNIFSGLVKQGIASGEFKNDFDAESFAIRSFAILEGIMWVCKTQNVTRPMRIVLDAIKKEIEDHCT